MLTPERTAPPNQQVALPRPMTEQRDRIVKRVVRSTEPLLAKHARTRVIGEGVRDRTATGIWPSDHAGLATQFRIPLGREGR